MLPLTYLKILALYRIMWYNSSMKKATSFRLSAESMMILAKLSKKYGVSMTAILELIIREKATKEGIKWTSNAQDADK